MLLNKIAQSDDIICDTVDHARGLHPHMSAPAITALLQKSGFDPTEYTFFTVTRHPVAMLRSYFKFFKPDVRGNYNYALSHDAQNLDTFDNWIQHGRVGIGRYWSDYVPEFVTPTNFSPLSLEAHICDQEGKIHTNRWFKIEDKPAIERWLSERLDQDVKLGQTNESEAQSGLEIHNSTLENLSAQFPMEFKEYEISKSIT